MRCRGLRNWARLPYFAFPVLALKLYCGWGVAYYFPNVDASTGPWAGALFGVIWVLLGQSEGKGKRG